MKSNYFRFSGEIGPRYVPNEHCGDYCRGQRRDAQASMSMVQMIGAECRVKNYEHRRKRIPRPLDKSFVIYDYRHQRYPVIRRYMFYPLPAEETIGQ